MGGLLLLNLTNKETANKINSKYLFYRPKLIWKVKYFFPTNLFRGVAR